MNTALAHRSLVALTPQDVPAAQSELAEWCRAKVIELSHELRDARQNCRQAKTMKWKYLPWERLVKKTAARMLYYTKIRDAVRAGYLIIPNFDVEVMAVRVQRERPPDKTADYQDSLTIAEAKPELLPPGVGRYVSGAQVVRDDSYQVSDPHNPGKTLTRHLYTAVGYDPPDFPVRVVKPVVMEATARAMALSLFDRIGVVTRQKDPIVVGELLYPNDKYLRKRVTFFIAWWFDTRTL